MLQLKLLVFFATAAVATPDSAVRAIVGDEPTVPDYEIRTVVPTARDTRRKLKGFSSASARASTVFTTS